MKDRANAPAIIHITQANPCSTIVGTEPGTSILGLRSAISGLNTLSRALCEFYYLHNF